MVRGKAGYRPLSPFERWLVLMCAWAPAAATIAYMKSVVLNEGGYGRIAVQLGLLSNPRHPEATFSFLQSLSFHRGDLLVGLILVPLGLGLIARWLPLAISFPAVFSFAAVLMFWLAVQRTAYADTGGFLALPFLRDGLWWLIRHPADFKSYSSGSTWIKAGIVLATGLAVSRLLIKFCRQRERPLEESRTTRRSVEFAAVAAAVLIAVSFGPWLPTTAYHASILQMIANFASETFSPEINGLPDAALMARYRNLVGLQAAAQPSALHGKAQGYDVIVWISETLPERVVAAHGGFASFPNLSRLTDSALILPHHYTTSTYSSLAMFSILTSQYPPYTLRSYFESGSGQNIGSFLSGAARMGYQTGIFVPGDASFNQDINFFGAAGASKVFVSDRHPLPYEKTSFERRQQLDQSAFAELQRNLEDWLGSKKRYAAVFFPEIGHGPWPDVTELGPSASRIQLREALLEMEDQWIGQLLDLLQRHGRLDKTIIVVTGDHGVRTRIEDPALPRARLDDYTFHVPLLLYAPGAFSSGQTIEGVTSHIDIAPSLLDLLGSDEEEPFFQGVPFWDPAVAQRKTFFFGSGSVGSDGFHSPGHYYSHLLLGNTIYAAPRMSFDDSMVVTDVHEQLAVSQTLQDQHNLQIVWVGRAVKAAASQRQGAP
jgi:Sulfatase